MIRCCRKWSNADTSSPKLMHMILICSYISYMQLSILYAWFSFEFWNNLNYINIWVLLWKYDSIFLLSGWKKLLVKLLHKIIFCEIEIINILNFALCFSSFPSTDFNIYTDFITQLILWCIIYIFILIPKVMIFSLKNVKTTWTFCIIP